MSTALTKKEIKIVNDTWKTFLSDRLNDGITIHYQKFFKLEPSAEQLFPKDISKLVSLMSRMLLELITLLETPDLAKKLLFEAGTHHKNIGVDKKYYPAFQQSLIFGIEHSLGDSCNEEIKTAWRNCISWAMEQMLSAY